MGTYLSEVELWAVTDGVLKRVEREGREREEEEEEEEMNLLEY